MAHIVIDQLSCNGCGNCVETCPDNGVYLENGRAHINESECTVCAMCIPDCPKDAISLMDDEQ